ncbi:MAG: FKBP-type peptidyl-prolyl cis-trans isomerase, partial [Actinomycetota bacterium]
MKRRALAPAIVSAVLLAVALTACSSDDDASPGEGPFPDTSATLGEVPELTFPDDDPADTLQVGVLTEGSGESVESGDLLIVHYTGQVWGGEVFDSSFGDSPLAFPIGTGGVIRGWDEGLVGQDVGSRVILTVPPEYGYGSDGNAAAGIGGTDTIVFVVDILGSYGAGDAAPSDALPTGVETGPRVDGDLGGPATVTVPDGTPQPTELTATVLATGPGEAVEAGGVVVQYAVTTWDNTSAGSTWDSGSAE